MLFAETHRYRSMNSVLRRRALIAPRPRTALLVRCSEFRSGTNPGSSQAARTPNKRICPARSQKRLDYSESYNPIDQGLRNQDFS